MLYAREMHHAACVEVARELPDSLLTCWPAITEAAYLLRSSPTGVQMLLSRIERGLLDILPLTSDDIASIARILDGYRDQGFDFADGCLMHLAEREGIDYIFTLDRRHFSVFRKQNGDALTLLPS
ncbi:MAG: PIN domain-containing protein [Planctomycetes bacterium]|nr:PIN domain-containing protein [Planctomycetota bacterium]